MLSPIKYKLIPPHRTVRAARLNCVVSAPSIDDRGEYGQVLRSQRQKPDRKTILTKSRVALGWFHFLPHIVAGTVADVDSSDFPQHWVCYCLRKAVGGNGHSVYREIRRVGTECPPY